MILEMKVPSPGESITEVEIASWLVEDGDYVEKDQAIAEIGWNLTIKRSSGARIKVTDKEVDAAIKEQEENKGKPEYKYSEIYLPVENASQESTAQQLTQRLVNHLRNGAAFAALARDFSKSSSAARGGDLGWVQSGHMAKEVETTLKQLPIGVPSNPVRTASGYHILYLSDKRISGQEKVDEMLNISQVIFQPPQNAAADILAARQGMARSLSHQAQNCEQLIELGKNIEGTSTGLVNDLTFSQMPGEVRTALQNVGVGQTAIVQRGKATLVLMVCKREKMAPTPEIVKRKALKTKLVLEKVDREDRRLLQNLRRAAFVDIRL